MHIIYAQQCSYAHVPKGLGNGQAFFNKLKNLNKLSRIKVTWSFFL